MCLRHFVQTNVARQTARSKIIDVSSPGNIHWNVPHAPNPLFTGRQDLLTRMKDHLVIAPDKNDRSVFVLQGIGGAGKSEVAIKFATENQDRCVTSGFISGKLTN